MKKLFILIAVLLSLALVACGGGGDVVEQARATAESVAQDVSDMAEEALDTATEEESGTAEETASEGDAVITQPEVRCDATAIQGVDGYEATLRFVNASGAPLTVFWIDINQTPPMPQELFQLENGDTRDEGTWIGHEFLLKDAHGDLLKNHVVSKTDCVIAYPHFGYEGDEPEEWAVLSEHYEMCGRGQEQSPIDLTNPAMTDLQNIVFEYGDTAVNILNNGHTIQVNNNSDSQIMIGETAYKLLQFHFHAPSEHAVDGQSYPIEMHLVHQSVQPVQLEDGRSILQLAVVGVMITEGAENSAFTPVWSNLPAEENGTIATGATVQVASLLPTDKTIFRYNGSLTTPPCFEDVIWSVMQAPVEMSAEQIAAFTAIIEGNNRPLQPINDRTLQLDETP